MDRDTSSWLIPLVLAAAVGACLWYYWNNIVNQDAAPPQVSEQPPVEDSEPRIGPLHPIPGADFADQTQSDLRPLPPLNESDEYFRLELTDLFGEPVANIIVGTRIIERVVATVDNLPRGHVAERMRPVSALSSGFSVESEGGNLYAITSDSYHRYDPLVAVVSSVDANILIDLYRRYYPLFQKAYVDLGYPRGFFNDRLVEAIDDMLATPVVEEPVILIRPHVLYEFEDPDLESRSSGQKLMLRMGSDNAALIKEKLRQVREMIANDVNM